MSQQPILRWAALVSLASTVWVVSSPPSARASVQVGSETIVRFLQQDTRQNDNQWAIPIYEYLQLDVGKDGPGNFSFHGYGWGRQAFGPAEYVTNDRSQGELLYGYVQYQEAKTGILARAGRQQVFAGNANETLDGVRVSGAATPYFKFDLYGGYPAAMDDTDGRTGDRLYGGRVAHQFGKLYEVGLSYKVLTNDEETAQKDVGIDTYFGWSWFSVQGFSARNIETQGWREHSYDAQATWKSVLVHGTYQQFHYEDYFATGAKTPATFRFLKDTDEVVSVWGGDVEWTPNSLLNARVLGRWYSYSEREEQAKYGGGRAALNFTGPITVGLEAGVMDSDSADNRYRLARGYFYANQKIGFVSADAIWVKYKEEIYGQDTSLYGSVGVGTRFFKDALTVKVAGEVSSDPYFDKDVRGTVILSYVFQP